MDAAADVAAEAGLLTIDLVDAFAIETSADREVGLEAADRNRRLQQQVRHAGLERRRASVFVIGRVGALELEADDDQAAADGEAADETVIGCGTESEKRSEIGGRGRRGCAEHQDGASRERADFNMGLHYPRFDSMGRAGLE